MDLKQVVNEATTITLAEPRGDLTNTYSLLRRELQGKVRDFHNVKYFGTKDGVDSFFILREGLGFSIRTAFREEGECDWVDVSEVAGQAVIRVHDENIFLR